MARIKSVQKGVEAGDVEWVRIVKGGLQEEDAEKEEPTDAGETFRRDTGGEAGWWSTSSHLNAVQTHIIANFQALGETLGAFTAY